MSGEIDALIWSWCLMTLGCGMFPCGG